MNKGSLTADTVQVIERGLFKSEHIFGSSTDLLGMLTLNASKSRGNYTGSDGRNFDFEKTSPWKSHFQFSERGVTLGNAESRGILKRGLVLVFENENYALLPGGSRFRSWVLRDSQELILCECRPRGAFKRGAQIRIINPLPFALLVFTYCLVTKRWQEQPSAA